MIILNLFLSACKFCVVVIFMDVFLYRIVLYYVFIANQLNH